MVTRSLITLVKKADAGEDTMTFAFTVMPDHCHWVLQMGERLALGQIVAKFKSLTKPALTAHQLAWQRNYFEHQLRPDETAEDYSLYVFLNPYRGLLLPADQPWSWWWSGAPESLRFAALLGASGAPPKEWIGQPVPAGLVAGE